MSQYQLITLYRVREAHERGYGKVVGYFDTEANAQIAAKGKGEWGSEGDVRPVPGLQLPSGEVFALADETKGAIALNVDLVAQKARIRAEAVAKLTPLERQVLGLED